MKSSANASVRSSHQLAGQALVEFALVVPVFLLLALGLIDVGRLVYINNAIAEGAREGARWGSVGGRSNLPSSNPDSIQSHTLGIMAAVPSPTVTVTCKDIFGNTPATCGSNDILTVTVSSQVTMFTPVVSNIVGPKTISAISIVTVNQ